MHTNGNNSDSHSLAKRLHNQETASSQPNSQRDDYTITIKSEKKPEPKPKAKARVRDIPVLDLRGTRLSKLERAILDALDRCIKEDGPIKSDNVGSATRRVLTAIKKTNQEESRRGKIA